MENVTVNNQSKKYMVIKNIFNKDFILSAIIPIMLFYIFSKGGSTLEGIIISGIWSVGLVLVNLIREREFNALATMSATFSGIGLIGTIISKNPEFYLVSPIVQDILFAIIFFVSLLFKKSLIQIIVEQSFFKNAPDKLKSSTMYTRVWKILSIGWGFLNISQAIVRIILLYTVSVDSYYAISTAYGSISGPLMIGFSIIFPQWYFKKSKV